MDYIIGENKTFPKNIFQVWLQGCDDETIKKRKNLYENKHNWELINDNWNYNCISDIDLEHSCKKLSKEFPNDLQLKDTLRMYNIFKKGPMHLRIDFGRYVILFLYGGLYVDMDAYILRKLDNSDTMKEIINMYENSNIDSILGLSLFPVNKLESVFYTGETKMINNAIMIASPYNPILKLLIQSIIKDGLKREEEISDINLNHNLITNLTGPVFVNKFLNKLSANPPDNTFFTRNKILYINNKVFEPCAPFSNCDITNDTVSIHQMEMSWISPFTKNMIKFYYWLKNNIIIILLVILFLSILIHFIRKKVKNKK